MVGLGILEIIVLGICGLIVVGGIVGCIAFVAFARRRDHGPLVSCTQCGRNVPPSPHCPQCGAALE